MPYKDPEKRREMGRLYWAKWAARPESRPARERVRKRWEANNPEKIRDRMREKAKRYRLTEAGQETMRRTRESLDPQRVRAYARVAHAVKHGLLVRGQCEACGSARVQAHHPRGYDEAHVLDVEWFCASHHKRLHLEDGGPTLPPTDEEPV